MYSSMWVKMSFPCGLLVTYQGGEGHAWLYVSGQQVACTGTLSQVNMLAGCHD